MFKYWLELDSEANWNKLTDALKQTGQRSLAKKIKDVLQGIIILLFTCNYVQYIYTKSYYKLKLFYHTVLQCSRNQLRSLQCSYCHQNPTIHYYII